MKIRLIIFISFFVSFAFSQITNTRKWRYTERDSLDNALLFYEEKNYQLALPILEKVNESHPKEDFIKYLYGICCLNRSDKYTEALRVLAEVYAVNSGIDLIEYDLARAYHFNYKFDEALELVNKHLSYKRIRSEDKISGELLKKYIVNAKAFSQNTTKAKVTNLGSVINSSGDEFTPVIAANESVMVFNYTGPKSKGGKQNAYFQPDANGIYTSDIYFSPKQNNKFQAPIALDYINTNTNDAVVSLSQDGQILFTYKNISDGHGDIYISYLVGETYSQPKKLKGKVNSYSWEGSCSLSPDGKTMYFASERSGGFGGKDIFQANLLADSTWGKVINLGDSVNTPYDEDSPFMHADGTTLFYSSNCIKSSGGYDVFRANMNLKDSTFRSSENIGFPINTPGDDINFCLAANGIKGYYTAGLKVGEGLKDLFAIETSFDASKSKLLLLQGTISRNNELVDADIKVEIISSPTSVFKNFSSNKGKFLVSLPLGKEYRITFKRNKFPDQIINLTTIGFSAFSEKTVSINFDPVQTVVKNATPLIHEEVKITPAAQVTIPKTQTIAIAKVATPSVNATPTINTLAAVKINTTIVVTTPTISVVKTVTPTIAVTKTIAPTPTVSVAKSVTPTITSAKSATSAIVSNTTASKINPSTFYTTPTYNPNQVTSPTVTAGKTTTNIATSTNTSITTLENFVPRTPAQEKVKLYAEKYPDISADSLEFRVQVAAYKNPKVYEFPHLNKLGPIDNILLKDGVTRVTVGGKFTTLRKAYEHNKKVVIAGQNDAFVTVVYKGNRLALNDLETMGIFVTK